jgi:mannose-6-phosphate isomerase-like protein (cupin superfamily)
MKPAYLAIKGLPILVALGLLSGDAAGQRAEDGARGRIVADGEGEKVVRRWGLEAAALIDPDHAGSQDFVVIAEVVPPGEAIPVHKHPHSEELILLRDGTATAIVGTQRREVGPGATIYVPRGEWHGMENHGASRVHVMGIFSRPGYHAYFRATSVRAGEAVIPFSEQELAEVRERFKDVIVFKEPE